MAVDLGQDEEIIAGINITPMVDIMLVLLIIFMLTASVIEDKSIKLELPEAATADKTEKSVLGVSIAADLQWYLNGEPTDEAGLRAAIRAEQELVDELQAVVSADKSVPYGEVVKVVDIARQEGVVKYALNTDPASAQFLKPGPEEDPETP